MNDYGKKDIWSSVKKNTLFIGVQISHYCAKK